MEDVAPAGRGLEPAQIERFIADGFVRMDDAFPRELAEAARAILWKATGCSPDDPATWTQPVIRLGMFTEAPFIEAANTPGLHAAFDGLLGRGLASAGRGGHLPRAFSVCRRSGRRRMAQRF